MPAPVQGVSSGGKSFIPSFYSSAFARARRFWKKIHDNDSPYNPLVTRAIRAALQLAKLGVYFKVIITTLFVLRFVSHSSQMTSPKHTVASDDHLRAMRLSSSNPDLRIVLVTSHGDPDGLNALLSSIREATYEESTSVALDIWLFTSSMANALPIILYPLAVALFGPPRFDHATATVATSFSWHQGTKTVIAQRTEQNFIDTWIPCAATANETLIFIDAARARALSPTFYGWLRRASVQRADVFAYALDAISLPSLESKRTGLDADPNLNFGNAVLLESFFPATSVFSPTFDAWVNFRRWHRKRAKGFFRAPKLHAELRLGGYDRLEAQRFPPVRAWFAQFVYEYQARVVHPVLSDRQTLVVRKAGTTDASVVRGVGSGPRKCPPGDGGRAAHCVTLSVDSEIRANEFVDKVSSLVFKPGEKLTVAKWNGRYDSVTSTYGLGGLEGFAPFVHSASRVPMALRIVDVQTVLGFEGFEGHQKVVSRIVTFGQLQAPASVTIVPASFTTVEMMSSWLCNVGTLHILPSGLVLLAEDTSTADQLRSIVSSVRSNSGLPSLPQVLVLSLDYVSLSNKSRKELSADTDSSSDLLSAGRKVLVKLARSLIIRDLLRLNIDILITDAFQVWLSDPMPYVRDALLLPLISETDVGIRDDSGVDGYRPDVVCSSRGDGSVSSSFLFLRASPATLRAWDGFTRDLYGMCERARLESRLESFDSEMDRTINLMIRRTLRNEVKVWSNFYPSMKVHLLHRNLFVDAESHLTLGNGEAAGVGARKYHRRSDGVKPVVLSSDDVADIDSKVRVLKRFKHWFLTESSQCDRAMVREVTSS